MIVADKSISSWPTVLRPAPGVQLFLAQDEGILFDEMGQKLFHLNSAAACIWCYIEETSTVEDLIQSVVSAMNIDKACARQFVLDMVRTWWRLGLVQGSRRQLSMLRPDLCVGEYAFGSTAIDETELQAKPLQHHYRLLDAKFDLSYPPEFESILHPILAHLQVQEPARDAICLTITRV